MSFKQAEFLYDFVPEEDRYKKEDAVSQVTIEKIYVDGENEVQVFGQDGIYEGIIQFLVDVYTPELNSRKKRKESQLLAFYFELVDTKRTPENPYGLYVRDIRRATPEKIK